MDDFSKLSKPLRLHFDQQFKSPLETVASRFSWDYWNVPGQYRLLRTPAEHFFGLKRLQEIQKALTTWGQKNLGCAQISPIWLSYYVDGFEQRLHCDNGHGPWAFVWSLSPSKPLFQGGQTKIMKPQTLEYWKHHQFGQGLEEAQMFDFIEPKFNRLVVFDPRVPHGVERVEGVHDPREARLVLHGWFTHPEPILSPGIPKGRVHSQLKTLVQEEGQIFAESHQVTGTLCFQILVRPSGLIQEICILTQNLRSRNSQEGTIQRLIGQMAQKLSCWSFPKGPSGRFVVLPLIFE